MAQYLAFALGPVQGFIAQSRRTADGWMGSYLLSYLIGNALHAVEESCGLESIIEPSPNVAMYRAIREKRSFESGEDPTVAALPNTTLIKVTSGDPNDVGTKCKGAIDAVWGAIAEDVKKIGLVGEMARASGDIWDNQVQRHWETYWAWGSSEPDAFRRLAERKALRTFTAWEEHGDRCTVCGQRMPLADRAAIKQGGGTVQSVVRACWESWAPGLNRLSRAPRTLVRPDGSERLCAICLIKRLLPWVDNPIKRLWAHDEGVGAFPSTSTMCTAKYRCTLLEKAAEDKDVLNAVREYETAIKEADAGSHHELTEPRMRLDAFNDWESCAHNPDVTKAFGNKDLEQLLCLDGDFYLYGESVKRERSFDDAGHKTAQDAYDAMIKTARKAKVDPPPRYWALVAMDGDHMGKFLRGVQAAGIATTSVSDALNSFAGDVPAIVRGCGGRTIFAGGDDVLAMLPVSRALEAADALRSRFAEAFTTWKSKQAPGPRLDECALPTISAALVYAHHQAPLGRVIDAGHALLNGWAKGRAGRDAIAVQRFMRGGPAETFACKWDAGSAQFCARMAETIELLKGRELASRTAYGLRRFAWMLGASFFWTDSAHRHAFLVSLLKKSRLGDDQDRTDGAVPDEQRQDQRRKALAGHLLAICEAADVAKLPSHRGDGLSIEPLIVARFLAAGGRSE